MADMIAGLLGQIRRPEVSQGLLALGGQMMQAGAQGAPTGAAFGQGLQAYQLAQQQFLMRQREAEEYARQQRLGEIQSKALEQITDNDLRLLAQLDPTGQTVAQVMAAQMKARAGVDTPALVQEYRFAVSNGYKGTLEDFIRLKRESYQSPIIVMSPQGPQAVQTSTGAAPPRTTPLPGLPPQYDVPLQENVARATAEGREAGQYAGQQPKILSALESTKSKNQRVISEIEKAEQMVGPFTAGPVGSVAARIPGTTARDMRAVIDTVKANIGFNELAEMRANSPTGGALGNVTERELEFLQATLANLEQSQSPSQLRENLAKTKEAIRASQMRIEEAYARDFGERPANGGGQRKRYNPATGQIESY